MIRGRTTASGDVEWYDSATGTVITSITALAGAGGTPAAADVSTAAISGTTGTNVQAVLEDLAARVAVLEAATP